MVAKQIGYLKKNMMIHLLNLLIHCKSSKINLEVLTQSWQLILILSALGDALRFGAVFCFSFSFCGNCFIVALTFQLQNLI